MCMVVIYGGVSDEVHNTTGMCPDQPHSSCDLAMYGGNVQRYDEGQKIYHWSEKAQGRLFEQNFTSKHQSDCRVTLKVQQ